MHIPSEVLLTSGPRGSRPRPPWSPDLEAPDTQFGGQVYNLRAKQWILGPFFSYFFQKKMSSLALLCISFTCHIIQVSLCASFHISSSYVYCSISSSSLVEIILKTSVSSANRYISDFTWSGRSLINRTNNKGPSTLP